MTTAERLGDAKFVARMRTYCVMGHELIGDLLRQARIEAASNVDRSQLLMFSFVVSFQLLSFTFEFGVFGVRL